MDKSKEIPEDVKEMAAIVKVMGHPVRLYILKKLVKMDSCCYSGDLVNELPIGRSTLSQHLKELKYAGLVQGEIDPPYIKYCLNRTKWNEVKLMFNDLFF